LKRRLVRFDFLRNRSESEQQFKANSQINFSSQRVNKDEKKNHVKKKLAFFCSAILPKIDIHRAKGNGSECRNSLPFIYVL